MYVYKYVYKHSHNGATPFTYPTTMFTKWTSSFSLVLPWNVTQEGGTFHFLYKAPSPAGPEGDLSVLLHSPFVLLILPDPHSCLTLDGSLNAPLTYIFFTLR